MDPRPAPAAPRHRRRRAALAVAVAVLAVAAVAAASGCGSSGREMPEPEPGAVSPTRSTTSTVSTSPTTVRPLFDLSSPAFAAGEPIPAEYSCNGPSPPLDWTVPVIGVSELALVVTDPDAGDFVHWIVVGIPPRPGSTQAGQVPEGGRELVNSSGRTTWFGPCPPPGRPHTYDFAMLSLSKPADIPAGASPADVVARLRAQAGSRITTYTGTFQR